MLSPHCEGRVRLRSMLLIAAKHNYHMFSVSFQGGMFESQIIGYALGAGRHPKPLKFQAFRRKADSYLNCIVCPNCYSRLAQQAQPYHLQMLQKPSSRYQ
jgi:hypothetical protein